MKNITIGIGIVLGMMVVPLALYIINIVAYRGNNVAKAVPLYINNSEVLKVAIPDADPQHITGLFDFNFKRYKRNVRADKNGDVCQILFYSKQYRKYFNLLLYDSQKETRDMIVLNIPDQQVNITVNKSDLGDALYGVKTNPVPVFKFDVVSPKNDGPFLHTTRQQYLYNVTQYLKFVMPAKEFTARYGQ